MQAQAVIFDLFGTLIPSFTAELFHSSLASMAEAVGIADQRSFVQLWSQQTWRERALGHFPTIEANVDYICRSLGVAASSEQLARATQIRAEFSRTVLQPRPDALTTLDALRRVGIRCGLISDCSAEVPLIWSEMPLSTRIEAPIFSCSVKLKKPDPRIYHLACAGLGVEPQRCVYVGDGFSQELSGAQAVGMYPVLLIPQGEVSADTSENERGDWNGPRIAALAELLPLIDGLPSEQR